MPDNNTNLASALAAFHAELPKVGKGSVNPAFKSKYADLADIVAVVLPALARQGLAWVTVPTMTENGFVLAFELRHVGGESIKGEWPLPDPTKSNAQTLGSAVTYGKRYALSAVTGIAPDEDDDGNAASAKGAAKSRPTQGQQRIADAVQAIADADTAERLDAIEAHAAQLGINGVKEYRVALAAKRAELGQSSTDHWAVAEVKP